MMEIPIISPAKRLFKLAQVSKGKWSTMEAGELYKLALVRRTKRFFRHHHLYSFHLPLNSLHKIFFPRSNRRPETSTMPSNQNSTKGHKSSHHKSGKSHESTVYYTWFCVRHLLFTFFLMSVLTPYSASAKMGLWTAATMSNAATGPANMHDARDVRSKYTRRRLDLAAIKTCLSCIPQP